MKDEIRRVPGVLAAMLLLAAPAGAGAPEPAVVEEILAVLEARGLIDRSEHERLATRYREQETERASLLGRIHLSGDLRLRGEGFWYDEDPGGTRLDDRYRARYRLRIGADADVNDWLSAHVRLASGEDDPRSTNTSFGRPDPDFDPDPISIDRAFLSLHVPEGRFPALASAALDAGKIPNPFVWKDDRDVLLWDNDITPEGFALRLGGEAAAGLSWFAHAGFFVDDENASGADPHLFGTQIGVRWEAGRYWRFGARAEYYGFGSIGDDFLARGADFGNVPDGLSSGGDRIDVAGLGAWVRWSGIPRWPIQLFGRVAHNFSADASDLVPGADAESLAWNAGLLVGDKRQIAMLGLGYFHLEANAFPAQFVDSDVFDASTNRRALAFWGSRRILPRTDLNVSLFLSEAIEDSLGFSNSLEGERRVRFQTDLVVDF